MTNATNTEPEFKTINLDGQTLNISDLSKEVQQLVSVYNNWNKDLITAQEQVQGAQTKVIQLQCALNDLARQIVSQIQADKAKPTTETTTETK
jgi:predicted  nucleic acid-binding Zn-ribbon protein